MRIKAITLACMLAGIFALVNGKSITKVDGKKYQILSCDYISICRGEYESETKSRGKKLPGNRRRLDKRIANSGSVQCMIRRREHCSMFAMKKQNY